MPARPLTARLALHATLAAAALATVAAYWLTSRPEPARAARRGPLVVDAAALDFGEVLESASFRREVPIRNVSERALDVRMSKSCDCAGVEPAQFRLGPGETKKVVVTLDLLHNKALAGGISPRPYRAHLAAAYGERGHESVAIEMTGTVRSVLTIWLPNLHFSRDLLEGEDGHEESVSVKPALPLSWLVVKRCPPYLAARLETVKDGYALHVKVKAGMPRGKFSSSIRLEAADSKGTVLPEQPLGVSGTVTGPFVCFPAESALGVRRVGSSADEVVRIVSRRGGTFRLKAIKASEATGVFALGDGERYRISQRIACRESREANVTFLVVDEHGTEHPVDCRITYYGTAGK